MALEEKDQKCTTEDQPLGTLEDHNTEDLLNISMVHMARTILLSTMVMYLMGMAQVLEDILMDTLQITTQGDQYTNQELAQDQCIPVSYTIRVEVKDMAGQLFSNQKTYRQWLTMMKKRRVDGLVLKRK